MRKEKQNRLFQHCDLFPDPFTLYIYSGEYCLHTIKQTFVYFNFGSADLLKTDWIRGYEETSGEMQGSIDGKWKMLLH